MNENLHITMDSFGDNCPENWEEIADYLNDRIEQATFDLDPVDDADEIRDIIDEIWTGYCERCRDGELEDDEPMPVYADESINMSEGEGRQTRYYWWAVDDATTKRGRCDSEKLGAQTEFEAVKEARAMLTRLTPHDRRERDAFWVGYAPEDEDGYMDFDAVKVKIDIK